MRNYEQFIRRHGHDVTNETSGETFKASTKEACAQVALGVRVQPGDVLNDPEWPSKRLLVSEVRKHTHQQLVYFHPFHLTGRIGRCTGGAKDSFGRSIGGPVTVADDVPLISGEGFFLVSDKVEVTQSDVLELHQTKEAFEVRAVSGPEGGLRKLVVIKQDSNAMMQEMVKG